MTHDPQARIESAGYPLGIMSESDSTPAAPAAEESVVEQAIFPAPPPSLVPPPDKIPTPVVRAKPSRTPPPPSTRSLPPMPAIEPVLEQAAEAREKGDWDGALEHYK